MNRQTRDSHDLDGFVMLIHLSLEIKVNMKLGFGKKEKWTNFLFVSIRQFRTRRLYYSLTTLWSLSFFAISRRIWGKGSKKKEGFSSLVSTVHTSNSQYLIFFPFRRAQTPSRKLTLDICKQPFQTEWTSCHMHSCSPMIFSFPCKVGFSGPYNVTLS